jgi:hypothetical protein
MSRRPDLGKPSVDKPRGGMQITPFGATLTEPG